MALTHDEAAPYAAAMRISFSTGTFYHRGLDYSLRVAHESGFDGVEYVIGPEYFLRGQGALEQVAQAGKLPVLSVHPPFTLLTKLPFVPWPRKIVRSFPRVTAIAASLGAQLVVSHTVFLYSGSSPKARRFLEALRMGRTAGNGITIAVESNQFYRRKRRYLLDDLATLTRFVAAHGYGLTFDTCHAGANGEDLLADLELVRPVLANVHLSDVVWRDGRARTHLPPGVGQLPLRAFLRALAASGYDGLLTLEINPGYVSQLDTDQAVRQLRQSVDFVREALS